jgi:hypothetical protein
MRRAILVGVGLALFLFGPLGCGCGPDGSVRKTGNSLTRAPKAATPPR